MNTLAADMKKTFSIEKVREQFPILKETVNNKPLVYLDNGATAQKPKKVIDAISNYYRHSNANIHRGVHTLSQKATGDYEASREKVKEFINANHSYEIIFTKGTTEAINLAASSLGKRYLKPGDEVLLTTMEHHSNIVPWQFVAEEKGVIIKNIPINDSGELLLDEAKKLITSKTKIVSVAHASNTLGTINPVKEIIRLAHEAGAVTLVDGAQSVQHIKVDVQDLDTDFYCFSGHKMYGPAGTGVLYGKEERLKEIPPYQGGGDMIKRVTFEKTTYNDLPFKFEAGTPNIEGAIGLGAAIDFINEVGIEQIAEYEHELLQYATEKLSVINGLRIIGTAKDKAAVISFLIGDIHPYDTGVILDKLGIAVRTGHHCTQPLMDWFKVPGTVRASFAVYNTKDEVDELVKAIERVKKMFA